MITMIAIVCVAGYALMIGATHAYVYRTWECPENEEPGPTVCSIVWPITLPAMLARAIVLHLFECVDERRKRSAAKAVELKQRIAELDKELDEELRVEREAGAAPSREARL